MRPVFEHEGFIGQRRTVRFLIRQAQGAKAMGRPMDPVDVTEASLILAVEEERYEDAARLRDQLRIMRIKREK